MRRLVHAIRCLIALLSIAIFCIVTLSAYGGFIDPLLYPKLSALHLAFPFLLVVSIAVSLVWFLCRGRFVPLCGLLTFIICFPQGVVLSPIGMRSSVEPGEDTFTVLTYNIYNGVDYEHRDCPADRTFRYILTSEADVVCTQEMFNLHDRKAVHISEALIDSVRKVYPYSIETEDLNFMALITLSKYPIRRVHTSAFYEVRYLFDAYEIDIHGKKLTLLNTHLSSYGFAQSKAKIAEIMSARRPFFGRLNEIADTVMSRLCNAFARRSEDAEKIRDYCNAIRGPLIVCGDMNDVPGSWAWNTMQDAGLRDACLEASFGYMPTYKSHNMAFHIDGILYKGDLRPLRVWRGGIRSSDHYPLFAQFAFADAS